MKIHLTAPRGERNIHFSTTSLSWTGSTAAAVAARTRRIGQSAIAFAAKSAMHAVYEVCEGAAAGSLLQYQDSNKTYVYTKFT